PITYKIDIIISNRQHNNYISWAYIAPKVYSDATSTDVGPTIEIIAWFCNVSNIPSNPCPFAISLNAGIKPDENSPSPKTHIIIFFQSRFRYKWNSVSQGTNFSFIIHPPFKRLTFIVTHEQIFKSRRYGFKIHNT